LQRLAIAFRRKFAVDLERRQLCNELVELRIGDAKASGARAVFEQTLS